MAVMFIHFHTGWISRLIAKLAAIDIVANTITMVPQGVFYGRNNLKMLPVFMRGLMKLLLYKG